MLTPDELVDLDFCPVGAQCIKGHRVYTDRAVDLHEMVHAVRAEALGDPLPGITFFEEGLAVMYQLHGRSVAADLDVYAGLESVSDIHGRIPGEHYGVAGHFTSFLVDTYGIDDHVAFLDSQPAARTTSDVENAFEDVIGEPLASVVDEYRVEYPVCSHLARARLLLECAHPPVLPEAGSLRVEYELACDDPEVLGPTEGRMWRSFTVDVAEAGSYRFTNAIEPFDFQLEVVDCDHGCLTDVDLSVESPGTIFAQRDLSPGRYLVRLSRLVDAPGRVGIDISGF